MIIKSPTPGNWTWELMPEAEEYPAPVLHDAPSTRRSTVLGPDGEPITVDVPRRAMGFDLRPTGKRG